MEKEKMIQFAVAFNKVAKYFNDITPVVERTQIGYVVIRPNSDPNWSDPVEYTAKFPDANGKIASKDGGSPVSSDDFKALYKEFISEFNVWVFKTGERAITEFIKSFFTYKKLGAEWGLLKETPHSTDMYMVDMFKPTIEQLIEAGMMDEVYLMDAFIEFKGWINDLLRPELPDIFTDYVTPSGIAVYRNNLQNDLLNRPTPPAASMVEPPNPISGTSAKPIPDELQTPEAPATGQKNSTEQQKHSIPQSLDNDEFREILQNAIREGLCTDQYEWCKGTQLAACFAQRVSDKLKLGKGENSDGIPRIAWKPFETLFKFKSGLLRSNLNDIKKTGAWPSDISLLDSVI